MVTQTAVSNEGLKLFRTAVVEQNTEAWEAIHHRYTCLIHSWLVEKSCGSLTRELYDDLVQETYIRCWQAFSRQKDLFIAQFPHIGTILKYLKRCTHSTYIDWYRKEQPQLTLTIPLEKTSLISESDLETTIHKKAQIAHLNKWLNQECHSPQEKIIIQECFRQGISPKKIVIGHSPIAQKAFY